MLGSSVAGGPRIKMAFREMTPIKLQTTAVSLLVTAWSERMVTVFLVRRRCLS